MAAFVPCCVIIVLLSSWGTDKRMSNLKSFTMNELQEELIK